MYLATDRFSDITSEDIKKQLEKSLKGFRILRPGDYIEGTIIKKMPGTLIIDVGARAEGIVSGRELKVETLDIEKLKEGDKILVYVISGEARDGSVLLSLRKAELIRVWLDIEKAYKNQDILTVKVVEVNTGGLICELPSGLRGFIPVSQLDPQRIFGEGKRVSGKDVQSQIHKQLSQLLGEEIQVRVYEVDRAKGKIIFSEKAVLLGQEDLAKRRKLLKSLKQGDILEGVVTGITPFGIFVNANGLEGLVHLSELSWDKVSDVSSMFKVGQKVKVMVLSIEDGGRRVAYSIKRLTKDPWQEKIKKYKVGDIVEGVIEGVVDFGAFVRIDEGINGLIHISEIAEKRINHPKDVLKEGDVVKVVILGISPTSRHLSLSLKRVDQKTGKLLEHYIEPVEILKEKQKAREENRARLEQEVKGIAPAQDKKDKDAKEDDAEKSDAKATDTQEDKQSEEDK